MIKKNLKKHSMRKTYYTTTEDITHLESLDWINAMVIRGYNVINFNIETYTGMTLQIGSGAIIEYPPLYNEKVRCVVEYN